MFHSEKSFLVPSVLCEGGGGRVRPRPISNYSSACWSKDVHRARSGQTGVITGQNEIIPVTKARAISRKWRGVGWKEQRGGKRALIDGH